MKLIPLTQNQVAMVDDEDYERVNQFKWYALKNGKLCYVARRDLSALTRSKITSLHRFILGFGPKDPRVDHKDGNGLNNQKANLRECTVRQNIQNSTKWIKSYSKFKGVGKGPGKGRWRAKIKANGIHMHLGCFDSEIEAAKAYNVAALKYFGEFARLNEVENF